MSDLMLGAAINMARAGQKEEARDLLISILNDDRRNVAAWKWLAMVAASRDEARQAINAVLALSPGDEWALRAAERLGHSEAQPVRRRRRKRSSGLMVALGLGLALAMLAGGLVAVIALSPGLAGSLFGQDTAPEQAQAPIVAVVVTATTDPALLPGGPTLPATWTPSVVPTLPTLTPSLTPTITGTAPPSPTKQPVVDAPPQSEVGSQASSSLNTSDSVVETSAISTYPVYGSNAAEINQSIIDNGPKQGSYNAIAQVQYSIVLHYTFTQAATLCTPGEAVAYLDLLYVYPEYQSSASTSQQILNQWDAFLARVVAHEETHAEIARDCALDMVADYETMSTIACVSFESAIAAMQDANHNACDQQQIDFDNAEGGDSFP